MNTNILLRLLLISTFSLTTLTSLSSNGYSIKIRVNGIKDTLCYLANYYGDKQYLKDTAKVDLKGQFIFEGKETLPGGIYLVVMPNKTYFEIIINDQKVFALETDTNDYIKNMKVKGSEENQLFYDYLQYINPKGKENERLRKELDKIKGDKTKSDSVEVVKKQINHLDQDVINYRLQYIEKYSTTFLAKVFKAMIEPKVPEPPVLENGKIDSSFNFNYYKSHFFDFIDFSDDRLLRTPLFHNKIKQYVSNLTLQHPDSIINTADYILKKARVNEDIFKYCLVYLLNTYANSNVMGMDAVYVYLVENYYAKGDAAWLDEAQLYRIIDRAKTLKPLLIGKTAPDMIMKDINGQYQSLHNTDAEYTILCFWDPDCGHCKKEIPKLLELYNKVKNSSVQVYAVCTEVEENKWRIFISDYKLDWINVADVHHQSNFRNTYDISSTPVIYLLDRKKEILAKKISVEQLEELLNKYLKA